jgi:hypothetical protein
MRDERGTFLPATLSEQALLGAMIVVAIALQSMVVPIDADVSWLITVSERVLQGQRLYIDVFEVNPPASVWLYLPQVALAKALGARPELVIAALTLVAALFSTLVTREQISRAGALPSLALVGILGFVSMIAPGGLFAQREHYALLLALPVAAVMARIANKSSLSVRILVGAGITAGLIVVIKPHFLLAVLFPAAFSAWQSRNWRAIAIAALSALAVIAIYAVCILVFARPYFDEIHMLTEIYGPMRQTTFKLLTGVSIMSPIAVAGIAYVLRPGKLSDLAMILLAMMAGFTIAAFIQGKGYWNHALPAISLGILAIAIGAMDPRQTAQQARLSGIVAAALAGGLTWSTLIIQPPTGLVQALRTSAPPNPKVISLGTELSIGHPATRLVGGTWVGSRAALYTAAGVRYRTVNWERPTSPEIKRWYDEDIDQFVRDVAKHRPDVVLVEDESLPWLGRDSRVIAAMRPYRRAAHVKKIEIWLRRMPELETTR